MPRWIVPALLFVATIALIPPAIISWARVTNSRAPRINLVPDMDYQPKFLPQTANPLFADGRAMRPPVEGTVARGELRADEPLHRGYVGGEWITEIPVPVTASLLQRGRDRYDIYCAPCHGQSGYGDGMIALRADELAEQGLANWTPPLSMHDPVVIAREDGHLFNTISHGIRNMPAYGSQISVADRWAIVGYVRALQRSQNATLGDVPEEIRPNLK